MTIKYIRYRCDDFDLKYKFSILYIIFVLLAFFYSCNTFSSVHCASTGSEHAVWGTFGAGGDSTLVMEEGAPLSGYLKRYIDQRHWCLRVIISNISYIERNK